MLSTLQKVGAALGIVTVIGATAVTTTALQTEPKIDTAQTTCTTDLQGFCTVKHGLGVIPKSVVVSPNTPGSYNGYMLNTVRDSLTKDSFKVRAMFNQTGPKQGQIWFSYIAYADVEVPASTTSAPSATTTTTSTTTTVPTTTSSPPAATTFPNQSSGLPANTPLTTINGDYHAKAGEVLDKKLVTGKLYIDGPDVKVNLSLIKKGISNWKSDSAAGYKFTVENSTIDSGACIHDIAVAFENYTLKNVKVLNFSDAFRGGASVFRDSNILIQDSYVLSCSGPGDHSDGYQGLDAGPNVVLDHNTIDQSPARPNWTAPIFNSNGSYAMTVTNNLLIGGGYSLQLTDSGGHSVVTGNKIVQSISPSTSNAWEYGANGSDCVGMTWQNNTTVIIDAQYRVLSTVGQVNC